MFVVHLTRVFRRWTRVKGAAKSEDEVPRVPPSNGSEDDDDYEDRAINSTVRKVFASATAHLPSIIASMDRTDALQFYGLFKQASYGPPDESHRPSWYDMQARAKFEAWLTNKNMSREEAMMAYCEKLCSMDPNWDPTNTPARQGWGIRPSRMMIQPEDFLETIPAPKSPRVETATEREWFAAMRNDDDHTMRRLLGVHPEVLEAIDQHLGLTALSMAIDLGCEKVAEFLIARGANVHVVDADGSTPLHYAAQCHRMRTAELLLAAGANKLIPDSEGKIAAECCDDPELAQLLRP